MVVSAAEPEWLVAPAADATRPHLRSAAIKGQSRRNGLGRPDSFLRFVTVDGARSRHLGRTSGLKLGHRLVASASTLAVIASR